MTRTVEDICRDVLKVAEGVTNNVDLLVPQMQAMHSAMEAMKEEMAALKSETAEMRNELAILGMQTAPLLSAFITLGSVLETHHGLDRAALSEQTLTVMHTLEGPNLVRDEIIRGLFVQADVSKGGQSVM